MGSFDARSSACCGRRDPPEHVARRRGRRGRADGCGRAPGDPGRPRRLPGRAGVGSDGVVVETRATSQRRRHASHRGIDRAGAGRRRRRRGHHRVLRPRRDRRLREPGAEPPGNAHAARAAPRSRRCPGRRLRCPPSTRAQRRADGEPDLPGRNAVATIDVVGEVGPRSAPALEGSST